MKYKKSIIAIMLAIFLISIAAASASDVNDAATASEDTGQIELCNEITDDNPQTSEETPALKAGNNDETASTQTNSEILTDGQYTYSDLREQIGTGGNKNLTKGTYTYNNDGDTIQITTSGVINGNGAVIDMAGSNISAFFVTSSYVTIKNLTIKNANYTDSGIILFLEFGSVVNCNFNNNSVKGAGGAVSFLDEGTVEDCNFNNNSANNAGGAISFIGRGTVENCNFNNNSANNAGGAISFIVPGTVRNCNFTNNKVTNNISTGGAVSFFDEGTVENCNFIGNTANNYGGAVYLSILKCSVMNCNFTNNTAEWAGAIFIGGHTNAEVRNCNFTSNAAEHGGAIFFYENSICSMMNCNFADNTACESGGAIYFDGNGTIINCNFTGNDATAGSAIYFSNTSSVKTLSNSRFLNNRANAESLQITKNENNIIITFTGKDNLLNAIYSEVDVAFTNVVYWGADGIKNTGSSTIKPSRSNRQAGQNITVGVLVNGEVVLNEVYLTDANGMIVLDIKAGENYLIRACHDTDSYYTEIINTISNNTKLNVNITSQTTTDRTVNITAESNIPNEVIKGKLLFILPNGNNITANYAGNGTWWAVHTFDDCTSYEVKATYIGLDNVTVSNATITINKQKTEITAKEITAIYNTNEILVVTLTDINGNPLSGFPLTVEITGLKTYTTDKNGQIKISVGKLTPKTYNIQISFKENTDFKASEITVKVTVKKAKAKITAKKKTYKLKAKTKKFTITLKDNKGKPIRNAQVILKVNGKTYKATTNSKGKATFKIGKLNKKGTYKATVTFKANKYYNKATKKVKITIK